MPKQGRAKPRPGAGKTSKATSTARPSGPPPEKSITRPKPPAEPVREAPARRSGYVEAVARYEQGVDALQRREFGDAARLFRSILSEYPEEKELHERVRLYLNVCERQAAPRQANPQTIDERVYAATLAVNAGRFDEAADHLRVVLSQQPGHDHAEYMLAVIESARGRVSDALGHLQRAVELNPDNRSLALQDPDLEALRDEDGFKGVLEATAGLRGDRRKSVLKTRGIR
jgi:tetratricopeptide (TPR) repeat protein